MFFKGGLALGPKLVLLSKYLWLLRLVPDLELMLAHLHPLESHRSP